MLINVAQLVTGPTGSTRSYELDVELAGGDEGARATIKGLLTLMRTDGGVLVQGNVSAKVRCECVRCLATFGKAVELSVEEEYVPIQDASKRGGIEVLKADGLLIDSQHLLDLEPTLREYAMLNVPIKPICKPDCAGLCVQCGTNLNIAPCTCGTHSPGPSDDKLSGLRALAAKYRII